jgi:hypothetical protein
MQPTIGGALKLLAQVAGHTRNLGGVLAGRARLLGKTGHLDPVSLGSLVSHPPQGCGLQSPSRYKDEGGGGKMCCGPRVRGGELGNESGGC